MEPKKWLTPTGISTIDDQHMILFDLISVKKTEKTLTREYLVELFRRLIIHYTTEEVILLIFHNKTSKSFRSHHIYHHWILDSLKLMIEMSRRWESVLSEYNLLTTYFERDDHFDRSLYWWLDAAIDKKTTVIKTVTNIWESIEALFEKWTLDDMMKCYESTEVKRD